MPSDTGVKGAGPRTFTEGQEKKPLTDDDKGHSDGVGQQVATHGLPVLAIAFAKEANQRVQLVFAQALWTMNNRLKP